MKNLGHFILGLAVGICLMLVVYIITLPNASEIKPDSNKELAVAMMEADKYKNLYDAAVDIWLYCEEENKNLKKGEK